MIAGAMGRRLFQLHGAQEWGRHEGVSAEPNPRTRRSLRLYSFSIESYGLGRMVDGGTVQLKSKNIFFCCRLFWLAVQCFGAPNQPKRSKKSLLLKPESWFRGGQTGTEPLYFCFPFGIGPLSIGLGKRKRVKGGLGFARWSGQFLNLVTEATELERFSCAELLCSKEKLVSVDFAIAW